MLQPRSNVHHSTHQSLIKTSHTALPPVCRDGKHHQAVPKRRDVEMREALSMVVMHIRVGGGVLVRQVTVRCTENLSTLSGTAKGLINAQYYHYYHSLPKPCLLFLSGSDQCPKEQWPIS